MPYKLVKRDGKFCIHKKNPDGSTGESRGCSDSREMAMEHMRALYAHEKKEIEDALEVLDMLEDETITEETPEECEDCAEQKDRDEMYYEDRDGLDEGEMEVKAVWSTASVNDLPDSAFLYVTPNCGSKDSDGKTKPRTCRKFPVKNSSGQYDAAHVRNAIARIPQASGVPAETKKRLQSRARSILAKLNKGKDVSFMDELIIGVSSLIKSKFSEQEEPQETSSNFMIWKEVDDRLRFLVRHTNNFRDDDTPREILSEASHRYFVRAVENKEVAYPELWLWHVSDWRLGKCDWLAYDDSGFVLGSGLVDPGKEAIAEQVAAKEDVACSHGMLKSSIERDPVDPTIITKYITQEITLLPRYAAANKLTGFVLLGSDNKEDESMAIPTEKRAKLVDWGVEESLLDKLEAMNVQDAAKAVEEGRDSKEIDEQVDQVESAVTEQAETTPPVEEAAQETSEPTPYPTREEIAEAFTAIMTPFMERLNATEEAVTELAKSLKENTQTQEEQVMERIESIPPASLAALLAPKFSAVGAKETRIDGRESLAKAGPAEAPAEQPMRPTGIPFIDQMLTYRPQEEQ